MKMTPTQHEKNEWSRLAQAAYAADMNALGHKFSAAASIRNGESITLKAFDELQATYRSWLTVGFSDIKRVQGCLDHINANLTPARLADMAWYREVETEARQLGLLPQIAPRIGCNCKPSIDAGIVYGADAVEAL